MPLAPPEVREHKRALAEYRRAQRKARPKAQPTADGQRQPRVRDPAYLAWLRRCPCVACAIDGPAPESGYPVVEAAHLRVSIPGKPNPGMQAKPDDRWATPLCRWHHQHDQHRASEWNFWARLHTDPIQLCRHLYAAFKAGQDGAAAIADYLAQRIPF